MADSGVRALLIPPGSPQGSYAAIPAAIARFRLAHLFPKASGYLTALIPSLCGQARWVNAADPVQFQTFPGLELLICANTLPAHALSRRKRGRRLPWHVDPYLLFGLACNYQKYLHCGMMIFEWRRSEESCNFPNMGVDSRTPNRC